MSIFCNRRGTNDKGTREITRLDITMQSLIQHISAQIIDFHIFLPKRFSDFSLSNCSRNQNIFFLCEFSFWSELYNKCQNLSGHPVSQLLKFLICNLCEYWSRVGIRVKKVIISNIYRLDKKQTKFFPGFLP